jgi:pilus assembly protein CpaB
MSLRLVVLGLILMTAAGLGLIAYQVSRPAQQVVVQLQPQIPPPATTAKVLVAARPIPAGTLIRDEDFRVKELPVNEVPEGAVRDGPDVRVQVRGALVRTYLEAGEPATMDMLLRPRDRGFLAAVLAPGTRAISMGVDSITGVAGLIWPGDRVDVILVQEMTGEGREARTPANRVFSETVLTDVRVIAVDQSIIQGASAADGTAGHLARVLTVQVSEEEAQRIAVALRLGRLQFTIRAAEPPPVVLAGPGATFGGDVSPMLGRISSVVGLRLKVIQGDSAAEVTFK